MDFSQFDVRKYPTVSVQEGYREWAQTYEETVLDAMDLRLLSHIQSITWQQIQRAADLACGTGRIGVWLKHRGVSCLDGVDLTAEMVEVAQARGVYRQLLIGNILEASLEPAHYDLITLVLADEHLPEMHPLYTEVARITQPGGYFVIVGKRRDEMKPSIDHTAFGSITIEGSVFEHDVLIRLSGQVKKRKKKLSKAIYGTSHILSLDEAKHVYEDGAQRLMIGTGQYGNVRLSEEAADYFKRKHCQVELLPTPEAIRAWNEAEGTVIGLFHVTC